MDFSKARDLFVNIFQISDLTTKIVDRGLISQKSRDLFARFPNKQNNKLFSNG
jgi:hypothetical protein